MPLFNENREPFDKQSVRGKTNAELLKDGTLPAVSGLFDNEGQAPDAILLSHAHEDHTGLLRYTNAQIPIYASKGTSKMMNAGSRFAAQQWLPRDRHQEITAGVSFKIGDFQVTPYAVDHSIYDSVAFLIEANGKTILYSGDLRLHGRKPGMMKTLLSGIQHQTIDVLLMEGTHFGLGRESGVTEYELEDQLTKHIANAPGLVTASFSPQHVDRLVGFIRAAIKNDRIFVVDVYTAYVLYLVHADLPNSFPEAKKENGIRVFYPSFFESKCKKRSVKTIHEMFLENRISIDEIRKNPSRYLMVFRPSMLESDFGNELPNGTNCIYSRWEEIGRAHV